MILPLALLFGAVFGYLRAMRAKRPMRDRLHWALASAIIAFIIALIGTAALERAGMV